MAHIKLGQRRPEKGTYSTENWPEVFWQPFPTSRLCIFEILIYNQLAANKLEKFKYLKVCSIDIALKQRKPGKRSFRIESKKSFEALMSFW